MTTYFFKVTGLIKLIRILSLLTLVFCYANKPAYSQNGQDLTLQGTSSLAFLGVLYVTQQAAISGTKPKEFTRADLLEVKDELLGFEVLNQPNLGQRQFENDFPFLSKYLKNLRRESSEFNSLLRHELLEIANWRLLKKRNNE